jgi:diguanylate cyclase (GGDEF)-like protein
MFASGVAFDQDAVCRQSRRLEYLETHDPLTGLVNISSFESQFETLARFGMYPLSLVIFRIDNLSDACGTMGYQAGNTMIRSVAQVIQDCFFDADMIGRTGGGEYCCALSGKTQLEIETHIDEAVMRLHGAYLNLIKTEISCGYAIADCEMDFSRLYHEAYQKLMRRRDIQKYLTGTSVVDSINAIISRKTGWGKRVMRLQSLSAQIGKALLCAEETLTDIKLLAKIADIGLIGIDDRLLSERQCLGTEDQRVYDSHYEVGREIISSIDSLVQMENLYADLFKRYDEWQDAIAIPSRIVAVARGFDDLMLSGGRMTYRELGQKMAAAKGTIYCPEMVDVLMDIARKYHTWPSRSQKS